MPLFFCENRRLEKEGVERFTSIGLGGGWRIDLTKSALTLTRAEPHACKTDRAEGSTPPPRRGVALHNVGRELRAYRCRVEICMYTY